MSRDGRAASTGVLKHMRRGRSGAAIQQPAVQSRQRCCIEPAALAIQPRVLNEGWMGRTEIRCVGPGVQLLCSAAPTRVQPTEIRCVGRCEVSGQTHEGAKKPDLVFLLGTARIEGFKHALVTPKRFDSLSDNKQ